MPNERLGSRLSTPGFDRRNLRNVEKLDVMETFGAPMWLEAQPGRWTESGTQRLIHEVTGVIGDGKEATVYACQADRSVGFGLAVAKVYRANQFRAFSNAARYLGEHEVRDRRSARALKHKTKRGKQIAHRLWIEREWETLCRLYDAGADTPAPYAHSQDAVLMEYFGDELGPAPLLRQIRLDAGASRRAFDDLMRNIEIFLACDRIHGDLSAYNVLWLDGRPKIIDFPQSIAASTSPDGYTILARDVRNLCQYFTRSGLRLDPVAIAGSLWSRLMRGQL